MVEEVVVVTVVTVAVDVVVVVVLERAGFQMSKTQKLGSVIGADSAPSVSNSNYGLHCEMWEKINNDQYSWPY